MRPRHKNITIIIFVSIILICFALKLLWSIEIRANQVTSNIATFSAVIFGLHITLIAILFGTKFLQQMYREIDPKVAHYRKIHTIRDYLNFSQKLVLTNIILVCIYEALREPVLAEIQWLELIFSWIIISVFFVSVYYVFIVFKILLTSMIESSKN